MKFTSLKTTTIYPEKHKTYDWKFSQRSLSRLIGVDERLVDVTMLALKYSPIDFGITEGVRSYERQKVLYQNGKSKTMRSRHLTGHAVDIVAYKNGGYTYDDFNDYVQMAEAFRKAAIELEEEVLWGGAWLKALNYYDSAQEALDDYVETRRSQGRNPFLDGPHFQLTWRSYPAEE